MKKYLVLFVVLAISQMVAAQSLIGTWKATYEEDGQTHMRYLVFSKPNKVEETTIANVFYTYDDRLEFGNSAGQLPFCPLVDTWIGTYKVEKNRWGETVIYLQLNVHTNTLGKIEYPDGLSEERKKKALEHARWKADFFLGNWMTDSKAKAKRINVQSTYNCEFIDANTFKTGNKTFERETSK